VNRGTRGVNNLPKTVTRQRHGCDLNPGPSAPDSSMLTTRLRSHLFYEKYTCKITLLPVLVGLTNKICVSASGDGFRGGSASSSSSTCTRSSPDILRCTGKQPAVTMHFKWKTCGKAGTNDTKLAMWTMLECTILNKYDQLPQMLICYSWTTLNNSDLRKWQFFKNLSVYHLKHSKFGIVCS